MRVGVYVDGFNLFYGGRELCPETSMWMWLDLRGLVAEVVAEKSPWCCVEISPIVYCTAEISDRADSLSRQQRHHLALRFAESVDHIELGEFRSTVKRSVVAVPLSNSRKGKFTPKLLHFDQDPIADSNWTFHVPREGRLLVSHAKREEKGTDVNIAAHLLIDVLTKRIDAAMVVTNDSDLAFPITSARSMCPVGVVNPRGNHTAGALRGDSLDGVGGHWWYRLTASDFLDHPLPDVVGSYTRPAEWT